MRALILAVLLCAGAAQAIGYQHGIFRSQATQGDPWTGTATIVDEHLSVVVHRDYLDVELEWTFEVGGAPPAEYQDALEIVGNINLEHNSALIGMVVWYKDMLLKAKLKHNRIAREEYEEVVDRDADVPPPPRDPVLIEYRYDDNYDIAIFPVEFGGTRRLRMRYLVPVEESYYGVLQAGFPNAFTQEASAVIVRGGDIDGFTLMDRRNGSISTHDEDTVSMSGPSLTAYYWSGESLGGVAPILPSVPEGQPTTMVLSRLFSLPIGGWLTVVRDFDLDAVLEQATAEAPILSDPSSMDRVGIYALVTSDAGACSTGVVTTPQELAQHTEGLRWTRSLLVHSSDRAAPRITWHVTVNDTLVYEYRERPRLLIDLDGDIPVRIAGARGRLLSLDGELPENMAVSVGYVDTDYGLLALEEDALPSYLARRYEDSGVPPVRAEDIFVLEDDLEMQASNRTFEENAFAVHTTHAPADRLSAAGLLQALRLEVLNGTIRIYLGAGQLPADGDMEIAIYSLTGRLLKRWRSGELHDVQRLEWQVRGAAGSVLLVVRAGGEMVSRTVAVR